MKMQRRLRAAAQRRSSELASAFTLHRNCNVNRWSSESHQVHLNGRVATEKDEVNPERQSGKRRTDVDRRNTNTNLNL